MFKHLCVIGVGLIGGSIAKEAKRLGLANHIVGFGRKQDEDNLRHARQLGVIDAYYLDIADAVQQADLVVIATPVGSFPAIFKLLQPHWREDTIYTDVGSTKGSVIDAAKQVFGSVPCNFIPAHPIAGAEQSGAQAARLGLFHDKRLIITPLPNTDADALAQIVVFWRTMESEVVLMDVEHHDAVLAATSHLPHLLAFALVGLLGRKDEQHEIFRFAAGGFKDFSRIASSDPTMWLDISLANKQKILPLLAQLRGELSMIEEMLTCDDRQGLLETLAYAKAARQRFLDTMDANGQKKT